MPLQVESSGKRDIRSLGRFNDSGAGGAESFGRAVTAGADIGAAAGPGRLRAILGEFYGRFGNELELLDGFKTATAAAVVAVVMENEE